MLCENNLNLEISKGPTFLQERWAQERHLQTSEYLKYGTCTKLFLNKTISHQGEKKLLEGNNKIQKIKATKSIPFPNVLYIYTYCKLVRLWRN